MGKLLVAGKQAQTTWYDGLLRLSPRSLALLAALLCACPPPPSGPDAGSGCDAGPGVPCVANEAPGCAQLVTALETLQQALPCARTDWTTFESGSLAQCENTINSCAFTDSQLLTSYASCLTAIPSCSGTTCCSSGSDLSALSACAFAADGMTCAAVLPWNDVSSENGTCSGGPRPPLPATFAALQQNVFSISCSTSACHSPSGLSSAGYLDLSPGNAYASLLGANGQGGPIPPAAVAFGLDGGTVFAGEAVAADAGFLLVDPGNPGNSFLLLKLLPNVPAQYGLQMPAAGSLLTQAQLTAIGEWIDAGAPND